MRVSSAELWLGRVEYAALRWIIARYLRVKSGRVSVDGLEMPYLECGQGDPVVLVHGFGADKESWFLTVRSLSRRRRIIVPDLPGHGGASAISRGRASAAAQARALVAFLDLLGLDRVHLVGNSMGGGISLRVAADHPERVRSLVLIDSAGPKVDPSELDLALEKGENPMIPTSVEQADELVELVAEKTRWLPRAIKRHVVVERIMMASRLEEIFAGWQRGGGADGLPANLERIMTPTLVIHGDCDRVIDASTGREIARRMPHAKLFLMAGVGHIPQIEVPRETAHAIDEFLDSHA